jgi:hypothetical protein
MLNWSNIFADLTNIDPVIFQWIKKVIYLYAYAYSSIFLYNSLLEQRKYAIDLQVFWVSKNFNSDWNKISSLLNFSRNYTAQKYPMTLCYVVRREIK